MRMQNINFNQKSLNKITNKISKTRKPAIFYTQVFLIGKKIKNDNENVSSFYVASNIILQDNNNSKDVNDYVDIRREIPKWNGSPFCAQLTKGFHPFAIPHLSSKGAFAPFGNPTKGSALSKPAPRSVGQGLPILVALILVLHRALITRWGYVVVVGNQFAIYFEKCW